MMKTEEKNIGNRIIELRKNKKIKQKELASRLGITPSRLNYWEKNKREPNIEMIKKISKELNTNPSYLIGFECQNTDIGKQLYDRLDDMDKAEIRGEIRQMLKSDKYYSKGI